MGRDKAGVVVDGLPMRAHVRRALAAVCDEVVQLGGPRDDDDGDDVIADAGEGPFLAVRALLHTGRGDRYVIAAVDQPRLTRAVLQRLLDVDVGGDGAVCFVDEPLPCVIAAGARARVDALADAGERRLRALTTATLAVSDDDRRVLVNVNTPAELASLAAQQAR
jgi:molybdopterin-guanine dinucleotide biosynthesis protein A